MSTRIAVVSDVHGNILALEAVRKALKKEKPDVVLVAGDLVMNGAEPGATVDGIREMEHDGAIVVQGNTDVAVADADYAAAFPWMLESGVPDAMRAAAEWAHDALDDDQLARLLPRAVREFFPGKDFCADGRFYLHDGSAWSFYKGGYVDD
jgi:Icc-related predicted phosphoesterase